MRDSECVICLEEFHVSRITHHESSTLFLTCDLLLRHRHSAWALTRACICVRPLTPDRKSSAVSQTTVAADVHQSFDVHLHLLTKISLNAALLINDSSNSIYFLFGQLPDSLVDADSRFTEYLVRTRAADAVDV